MVVNTYNGLAEWCSAYFAASLSSQRLCLDPRTMRIIDIDHIITPRNEKRAIKMKNIQ